MKVNTPGDKEASCLLNYEFSTQFPGVTVSRRSSMDFHEVMDHPLPSPEGGIRAVDPQLAPQSGTIVAQQPPTPAPIYHSRGPRCVHPHYTLRFGAKPVQFEKGRFQCSNTECKKTRKKSSTKGCGDRKQAVQKHIMREHPDKFYRIFVCVKCGKKKESPLQILEHISSKQEHGGHGIKGAEEKLELLRAEHKGRQFR